MKKIVLLLFGAAMLAQLSCAPQKVRIAGRVEGWGSDTLVIRYSRPEPDTEWDWDFVYAKRGKFRHKISTRRFTRGRIASTRGESVIGRYSRSIQWAAWPGERTVIRGEVRADTVVEYRTRGSRLMADFSRFRAEVLPHEIRHDSLWMIVSWTGRDTQALYRISRQPANECAMAWIRSHPGQTLSGVLALDGEGIHPSYVPLDSFPDYYNLLSDEVKNGPLKSLFDARMEEFRREISSKQ